VVLGGFKVGYKEADITTISWVDEKLVVLKLSVKRVWQGARNVV
jgi:hypothetical protein